LVANVTFHGTIIVAAGADIAVHEAGFLQPLP